MIHDVGHECDPPVSTFDIDKTLDFYCTLTCSDDGCNRHTVKEISSNGNEYFDKSNILLKLYFIILMCFYFVTIM
jgi:hypothetical protein